MLDEDTIAAIATAPGNSGIGVIRLSGKNSFSIAKKITSKALDVRHATFTGFYDRNNQLIDNGLAIYFQAPHSFTGEDVVELQAHGSAVVLDLLLKEILFCGARQARAGEFSERAFLNNKIDLLQAEAIADLIASGSEASARAAIHSLQGEFSKEINALIEKLIALRVYIEAAMDFPEEEVDFLTKGKVREQLIDLQKTVQNTFELSKQGVLQTEGITIVIAGKPNAGKSSLLNALAARDVAIVTPIAGTTRDVLREHIQIDGMPLHIIDTAGLRESNDVIEQEGIARARKEINKADHVLLVVDSSDKKSEVASLQETASLPKNIPITLIKNKCDLLGLAPSADQSSVTLSAKTGAGLDLLKQHLKKSVGYNSTAGRFSARRRHLQTLEKAQEHIRAGLVQLETHQMSELLAEELRLAQLALEEITGRFLPDDLLDKIFRDFCIGK